MNTEQRVSKMPVVECSKRGCAGRFRSGGTCPLHDDEIPSAEVRSWMDHRGHRGGGRQIWVNGHWVAYGEARQVAYGRRGAP